MDYGNKKVVPKSINISERLRKYRQIHGLTQPELGKELGVTGNYVGMMEAGRTVDEESSLYKLFLKLENSGRPSGSRWHSAGGARAALKRAREKAGMSQADLAKKISRPLGYIQALEDGHARISELTVDEICKVLPKLDREVLLAGSELPNIISQSGEGTYGATPNINLPEGVTARYVPLISWTQAGSLCSFDDEAYEYEGQIAFDVEDRKAIALVVRGDSMTPQINENDIVILYPSFEPKNGEVVVARLSDDQGGDVMCKVFHATNAGQHIKLTSYNPAHPPLEYERRDFRFIYPVASVVKRMRRL